MYCSPRCKRREEARRARARAAQQPTTPTVRSCELCAQPFTPTAGNQVYCSAECRQKLSPLRRGARQTRHMHPEVRLVDNLTDNELRALTRWPHLGDDPARQEAICDDVAAIIEARP